MGNKNSKSVNITTPKGEVVADENNHVGNGDTAKNDGNHITIEGTKELMKDIANEAVKKGEEVIGDLKEKFEKETKETPAAETNGDAKEETTPSKEEEKKEEGSAEKKKKVQKKLSFRRFSFLRKEKKSKEDKKQTNGDVTTEKKEEEKAEGAEVKEGEKAEEKPANGTVPKVEEAVAETPAIKVEVAETLKVDEPKVEEKPAVVEKVEEAKVEEPKITELVIQVDEKKEESMAEKVDSLVETLNNLEVKETFHDVGESITEKVESAKGYMKDTMEQLTNPEPITNGISEVNGHKEVETAE